MEFWEILDLLRVDFYKNKEKGFYANREDLLNSYKHDKMYVMEYLETDELYEKRNSVISHIISPFTLKAFCTLDEDNASRNYVYFC